MGGRGRKEDEFEIEKMSPVERIREERRDHGRRGK